MTTQEILIGLALKFLNLSNKSSALQLTFLNLRVYGNKSGVLVI